MYVFPERKIAGEGNVLRGAIITRVKSSTAYVSVRVVQEWQVLSLLYKTKSMKEVLYRYLK